MSLTRPNATTRNVNVIHNKRAAAGAAAFVFRKVYMCHLKSGNVFNMIYDVVRQIPRGKVATYGQIAMLIGNPRMSRVVGYALHVNPEPGVIPCHRVVNRFGELSGAFAFGGENRQRELLSAEGITFLPNGRVDLKKHRWI